MPKARTFTSKITWLISSSSIVFGVVACAYVLFNEYHTSTRQFLYGYEQFVVATDYQRQLAMHYRDKAALEGIFDKGFRNESALYIILYDAKKEIVTKQTPGQPKGYKLPIVEDLRQGGGKV